MAGECRSGSRLRVVVGGATPEEVGLIEGLLAEEGADAVVRRDLAELCCEVAGNADAAILSEEAVVGGAVRLLADALKHQPQWSELPILLMAAGGTGSATAIDAMRTLGNVLLLDRPVPRDTLASALRMALKARRRQWQVRDLLEEAQQREQSLGESEDRFRTLAGATFEGVAISEDGRLVDANEQLARILGYELSELVGMEIGGFLAPEERERLLANVQAGREVILEHHLVRKDGSRRTVEAHGRTITYQGRPVRITAIRDVTEAKRAEQALRESEERFRVMAETVPEILFTNTPDGLCDYANTRCYEYTGLPPGAIEGPGWQEAVHPEDRRRLERAWLVSARTGQPLEMEYRFRAADGTYRWFRARARPIRDARGSIVKWFGACMDIDDIRRAHEALKRSTEELKRSNEDLEQFAYVVSHDLQSPLAQIVGFTQLLRKRCQGALDEKADEFMEFVIGGAKRMSQLINGLLAYSRVGTRGRIVGPIDAQGVLTSVLANLKSAIDESCAVVNHEPLPIVRADAVQLSQLFQNLIENAIKFRRDEPPTIHIGAHKIDGMWEFAFRDNGIGIDPRQQHRVFLVFQRLHDPAKYPGMGIGLAICKRIVERHGGRIWIESQPGEGSTFHFTLPDAPQA
jgi:PAS domain S-box-containing protein